MIARLLHQSRKIRPLCAAQVYPRAAPSRPRSDLVSPTERFCHFKIYRGGASRNFRPVDTRDRSPLLLILLLSASPSRGTARDKRGFTLTGQTAPLSQTETPLHAQIIHTGRVHRRTVSPSLFSSFALCFLCSPTAGTRHWIRRKVLRRSVKPTDTWGLLTAWFVEE